MVTLDQLAEKIDRLESKVEKLQDDVSRGKGAVSFLAWIGGIVAIVTGYFYSK